MDLIIFTMSRVPESLDLEVSAILDQLEKVAIRVERSRAGGIIAKTTGYRIHLFLDLLRKLYRFHELYPAAIEEIVARRGSAAPAVGHLN